MSEIRAKYQNYFFKFINFMVKLLKKVQENELLLVSYALTYKLLLSIFPFIIFVMTIIGFLNIDISPYLEQINQTLPLEVSIILEDFLYFLTSNKALSLLSFSFIISIYSASSGFNAVITGLNKVYAIKDARNIFKKQFNSTLLVFIFTILILLFMVFMVFGDYLKSILLYFVNLGYNEISYINININISGINNILNNIVTQIILFLYLLFTVLVTYKMAIAKKIKLINILPGSVITVGVWIIASKLFNLYINNFSKFSVIYGSIGSIFVLLLWLNIISFVLLLGGQINALLELENINET